MTTGSLARDMNPATLAIPAVPSFVGTQIYLQGFTDGSPYAAPFFLTNSILATICNV